MGLAPDMIHDAVTLVESLLGQALASGATDLHLDPGSNGMTVRHRIDGVLHDVDRIPSAMADGAVARLKVLSGLLTYRIDVPQEGSFEFETADRGARLGEPLSGDTRGSTVDMRVATFPTIHGERVVVRLFDQRAEIRSLDQLGLGDDVVRSLKDGVAQTSGLILVTGPAGAGKSTTLYALARHIRLTMPGRCVVSLEDPVEQRVEGLTQIQVQPFGELNYAAAMRSLLRQDVEVLLVGEIRDAHTAHVVIEAALTGHLILSTLHSGDPAEAIARLVEMGIAPYQLTSTLQLVCSQRLLRKRCTKCGGARCLDGCDLCASTGFYGRTACAQLATIDDPLRRTIVELAPTAKLREVILENHPNLYIQSRRMVRDGITTAEEVMRVLGADTSAPTRASAIRESGAL